MKKSILYSMITFILGLGLGASVMLLAYPFLFPPAEVNEQIINSGSKQVTLSGIFIHPNPSDPVHWGKGAVKIYSQPGQDEIFLGGNFEVGPGPDFHLYLSTETGITKNDDFINAQNFELGKLKSFRGSQVYNINNSIDMQTIHSVVVWCKAFGQLISSAELE